MNRPDASRIAFSELTTPEDEQFRMRSLTVWNWGTFSKVHTVNIAEDGILLLGPSGAGKSTLLDAISVMIVPPKKLRLNAAAEEGDRTGHDRTLISYVRGAWADKGDEGSREVSKQFLRPDATWSAITLEYRNRLGRVITLLRVFWINSALPSAPLFTHHAVIEGPFDMVKRLRGFDRERRTLTALLDAPDVRDHKDSFARYQEHWCRIMGIQDPAALDLLHRTQSTKSLGDLNTFLRDFMLTKPETFEKAQLLVDEFADLDQAHRAVVAAREQVELLSPARAALEERDGLLEHRARHDALLACSDAFADSVRVDLLSVAIERAIAQRDAAIGELSIVDRRLIDIDETLVQLDREHTALGGGDIVALEHKLLELQGHRQTASRHRQRADDAVRTLGWTLASEPHTFAQQVLDARAIVQVGLERSADMNAQRRELELRERDDAAALQGYKREIARLETSSSNIPVGLQDLRDRMCRELGLSVTQMPFVGELVQVRSEEREHWGPAAERLLNSFALNLLIDEKHQRKVARWVDETHLGLRLTYQPVATHSVAPARRPPAGSILEKLELKDHAFKVWVARGLAEQFDYLCVDSVAELVKGDRRITAQGQIRHRGGRTVKDDRYPLRDRLRWVLGFSSREKLDEYRLAAQETAARLATTQHALSALENERQQDHVRQQAARDLAQVDWSDIDVVSIAGRITDVEGQRERLLSGNRALNDLEGRRTQSRELRDRLLDQRADLRNRRAKAIADVYRFESQRERSRIEAGALSDAHRLQWRAFLPEEWTPTLDSLDKDLQGAKERIYRQNADLDRQANRLESQILEAFADFIRRWPEESGALQRDLACAADFIGRLDRLERDGLPAHEARFLDLLRTRSLERLAELSRHLSEARREITTKLDDVNEALYPADYSPGTYLTIEIVDLHLPEPREFDRRLRELFQHQHRQVAADSAEAEAQFHLVRELVMDLKAEDKRGWRELVLDVRRHVEFLAYERERTTGHQVQVFSGSAGKSGGQRQKLTATCLAAALRYQLGGADGGVSQYAPVVLDEAFTKTDSEFTATCMSIFKKMGFQMIIGTPIKSVMTLEEFVGGAVYVSIRDRQASGIMHIDYEPDAQRLAWSERDRAAALADEDA
jgi:uncharacterized protein YPO0396